MDVLSLLSRTSTEKDTEKEGSAFRFAQADRRKRKDTERRKEYGPRKTKYGYERRIRQVTSIYTLSRIQYCGKTDRRGYLRGRKRNPAFRAPGRTRRCRAGQCMRVERAFLSYRRKVPMAKGLSAFFGAWKAKVTQLQIFLLAGNRGERAPSPVKRSDESGMRRSAERNTVGFPWVSVKLPPPENCQEK